MRQSGRAERGIRKRAPDDPALGQNRLPLPRLGSRRLLSPRETLKPGVDVLGTVNLASALDIRVRRQGLLDEVLYLFLTRGVTLDRFHDETVRRAAGFPGERGHTCLELWRQLNRGGGGCHDSCCVYVGDTKVAPLAPVVIIPAALLLHPA